MGVEAWSTNSDANQYVEATFIGEGCPAANINNAIRTVMADSKIKFDSIDTAVGGAANAAIGALTPAANNLPTFTSSTEAALAPFTSFGLGLLNTADAPTLANALGAVRLAAFTPGTNGVLSLLLGDQRFILQWGTYGGSFGEGAVTIPFNIPFPTGCWFADPWPIIPFPSNTNDFGVQQTGAAGASSFDTFVQKFGSSGSTLSGIGWIAGGN